MRKNVEVTTFIIGCVVLAASFAIGWADLLKLSARVTIMQALLGALAVIFIFLILMAVISEARDRWRAVLLGSIMLLGFAALTFFSIGFLFVPLGIGLLILSLIRLRKYSF